MKQEKVSKKVIAIGLVGLVAAGAIGAVSNELLDNSEAKIVDLQGQLEAKDTLVMALNESLVAEQSKAPVVVTEVVNNTVEVEVPVVDEVMLKSACDRLLFDDLSECKAEIEAEDSALALALAKIDSEFADEDFLEELEDDGLIEDKDEVSVIKVYDSFEDITVSDSDYDDAEYEFVVKVKVDDEEADARVYLNVTVSVEDNEAKVTDVVVA